MNAFVPSDLRHPSRSARTPSRFRAVVFDLDDTLVAFDLVTASSWRTVCAGFCARRSGPGADELYEAITRASAWYWSDPERHREGRSRLDATRREIMRTVFASLGLTGPEDPDDADSLADEYSRVRTEAMYLFPGARETLDALRSAGYVLALLTNGEAHVQRSKIERFGLADCFDSIHIEGEAGYGKPDVRIYRDVLRATGTEPFETVIVGDNLEWEIRVPASLGMRTIWHDSRGTGLPAGTEARPDCIVRSPAEVPGALARIG